MTKAPPLAALLIVAGLCVAGCSSYSDAENSYWEQAVRNGAAVDEKTSVAIGHQACSMFQSGESQDTVVFTVWNEGSASASQSAATAMVDAAHEVLCPQA